ncbi:MAG: aldehyde ferredoxin oxidoreductase N-terminal domain-containing protein, partial [Anaerolineales bacterium]
METLVWRANVSTRTVTTEPVPEAWARLGGRGLIARVLLDEVPPTCDPLGPFNKLVWAPGLLVGHMVSSCDRISVGGKSPLTGGVKESNAGGSTGLKLTYLGIKALLLEGAPMDDQWQMLILDVNGGHFEPIGELVGMGVYEASQRLLERFGKKAGVALIGPGGEMQLRAAGIQNLDKDREASRINARGGLGAVMGAKRVKAIVIDATGGEKPPLVDPAGFKAAQKYYTQQLMAHPQTKVYEEYGTAAMALMCDGFGALPTRNFSSGSFESVDKISGETMRDIILERGGEAQPSHACMTGCVIRCSNCYGNTSGQSIVSPLEYETIGLVGSNLGIDSLDDVARLNKEINDLGLDTIEIGAALGVACDAGLMEFDDAARAMELLGDI